MTLLIILAITIFVLYLYFRFFKLPKFKNVVFVDGGLGTGKSFLTIQWAIREYKKRVRHYKIKLVLCKIFSSIPKCKRELENAEKPLLYSNINLRGVDYVLINRDLIHQ